MSNVRDLCVTNKIFFVCVNLMLAPCIAFATILWAQQTPISADSSTARGPIVWEPPTYQFPDRRPAPTVPKMMIERLQVARMQIVLETTELVEVQKRLGGTRGHSGDASESLGWLCLNGNDINGRWVLWLESSEMEGGRVDGFAWQRLERNARVDSRCGTMRGDDGGVELPIPLRLGLTELQVREIMGRQPVRYRNVLIYDHEHEETIRTEPFSVLNRVIVALRDGMVWTIQVWKGTEN